MEEKYAGLIKTTDEWWVCLSKTIYGVWDLPESHVRDGILLSAAAMGLMRRLGPSSMTADEAYSRSLEILGIPRHAHTLNRDQVVGFIREHADKQEE